MVFTAAKSDREYQKFKDKEEFFGITGFGTTGLVTYFSDITHVKDVLLINAGSVLCYYNFGVSGVNTPLTSTSGIPLNAGAERSYNEVGFDWVRIQSATGTGSRAIHIIYDAR